ncbi:MAG: hypothetical protein NXH80_14400 [Rhodobacteraceae bacterium]|nr:hypothetical protein [Paracoccaceae bacterium]
MSDPVTNVEIEDVLSSIRKLVADEVRSSPVARKAEKPGRLILTPAQRIKDEAVEPTEPPKPVLLTQPILPETAVAPVVEKSIDEIPGDARLAEFGQVEGAFPDVDSFEEQESHFDVPDAASTDDWLADAHEDLDTPYDASASARSELNRLIEEEVSAALAMTDEDDAQSEEDDVFNEDHEDSAEVEADKEWHAAEDDPPQAGTHEDHNNTPEEGPHEMHDDHGDDHHGDMENSAELDAFDDDEWTIEDESELHPNAEVAASEPMPPEVPTPPQSLEDKVAALGRLVARDSQEFEEERDRPDADDLAAVSEPMTWPEAGFEEVEEQPADDGSNVLHAQDAWPQPKSYQTSIKESEPVATGSLQTYEEDQAQALEIDEETLRQMVGEIVRQELQGALGERITRNVRKLVRREIHRMLISQEFD